MPKTDEPDALLRAYVHSLVKRLRAQPRTTLMLEEKPVAVVLFAGQAIDQVADKLAELSKFEEKPSRPPRRR